MNNDQLPQALSDEKQEWLQALDDVVRYNSREYAEQIIRELMQRATAHGMRLETAINTAYVNTISVENQEALPDDGKLCEYLTNIMRWNAIAIVMRGGKRNPDLGGHIASYGALATLFEVGFTYFFRGRNKKHFDDLIYVQGHSSPGIYARAFLEGRVTQKLLDRFREEALAPGLSSYPHPWLMPDFWQFPTVSMGLGPLMAIYQARFLKYLNNRGLLPENNRKVIAFCGDGEMGEPESLGAITLAARDRLDNLIFVISCNLQRLDGTVFGNGQIIQEFEGVFRGAGWNVIKVIWGSGWDELFAKDKTGILAKRISELVDGEYQNYSANDGEYFREHFFGKYAELRALVEHLTDDELKALQDGGHDIKKVYAAFYAAYHHQGQPTVILAKTVKGYGMGKSGEARNVTHQTKKIPLEDLIHFRQRFGLDLSDQQIENLDYYKPKDSSPEIKYLHERREALGGYLPKRMGEAPKYDIPELSAFKLLLEASDGRELSTTMAFGRILAVLLRDKALKDFVVPILADESRTFGLEGLFRQIGIYSPLGQQYQPEDHSQLMYYREDKKGQLLQEGISEAGGMCSWIAAATSYATNGLPMIPFFIYYSMFGYQRFGDLVWAAGDMQARGFIMGGTAGRTTLAGEGLQHQDGHNILMFSMMPTARCYDPCFAYELTVIVHHGLIEMYQEQKTALYYITLMNENYAQPAMPEGVEDDIIKGMYLFRQANTKSKIKVQLLGAGTILREVIKAGEILEADYGVAANIWSVTSFTELRRELIGIERQQRLHPENKAAVSHVEKCLAKAEGPVIAATDYIRLYADQIRDAVKQPYYVLGTDGFGRSDGREALREFFEVDAKMIAYTALKALHDNGQFSKEDLLKARKKLAIAADRADPREV